MLEKATSVFPDPSWSYWRGAVLFQTRGAAAAREEFRRLFLMEEAPWFLRAHERLGSVAMAEGRFREAAEELGKGAEVADTTGQHDWVSSLRLGRGQACLEAGDAAAAVDEAVKAVEAARKASQSYRLAAALTFLATAQLAAGDAAAAEATAAQSLALASTGKTPRLQREHEFLTGLIELEAGRPGEAVKLIGKAVSRVARRDHFDGRVFLYGRALAAAREQAGDAAGAAEVLENARRLARRRPGLRRALCPGGLRPGPPRREARTGGCGPPRLSRVPRSLEGRRSRPARDRGGPGPPVGPAGDRRQSPLASPGREWERRRGGPPHRDRGGP
ncbi:MAG: hypothetical protein MZV70_70940 [Desulfobacterales bacterium]|nr:hypothetical protein [Desulfobacterales bacterium]